MSIPECKWNDIGNHVYGMEQAEEEAKKKEVIYLDDTSDGIDY
jgi:hypothetical protein